MTDETSGPVIDVPPAMAIVCAGCRRRIEHCFVCDETDCSVATCYRCLLVDLTRVTPELHEPGG
jgi:hypothetical protein